MRDRVTDWLDIAGTVAISVGVTGGLWSHIGWWSACIGGAVVIVGSQIIARYGESEVG